MAVLYSNNFESPALHIQACADFTISRGSNFFVFHSGAGNIGSFPEVTFVQGVRSYGTRDNDENYCNLIAARADSGMRTAQSYRAGQCIGHWHRVTEGQDRGIVCSFDNSGGFIRARISVQNNGSMELSQTGFDIAVTTGDVIHMESLVVGTLTSLRIWKNAEPRPSTATVTHTSNLWTTGRVGLRMTGNQANYRTLDHLVITDALGGEDFFYGADTTAPTLTSPTGTQTGATTASGTVSTDEGNGTLYRLASINSTESVATVKAANITQAVTATGVQNVTFTGLSPSTTYFAHYVHTDAANNDSARVSSSSFTTSSGDATAPTLTGSITVSALAPTSYTLAWPAGSDNVAVTSYERSLDGGSSWVDVGNVLTVNITGRTPGNTDAVRVRAKDGSGNVSTPALSASVNLPLPTLTSAVVRNNTGTVQGSVTIPKVTVLRFSDMTVALNLTNQNTSAGILTIANASLVQGTGYVVVLANADGSALGVLYGVAT